MKVLVGMSSWSLCPSVSLGSPERPRHSDDGPTFPPDSAFCLARAGTGLSGATLILGALIHKGKHFRHLEETQSQPGHHSKDNSKELIFEQ